MAYGTINADLMTTSDGVSSSGLYGFKNRIINGAMVIDQRNAGASVSATNFGYTLDRWQNSATQTSKMTIQQSTTVPAGFKNSLLVTSSSAYSITSTDRFSIQQYIEGLNVTDLSWGTASAQTVTLSFWVRSSLTGTFGGSITNAGGSYRDYPFGYTINSANIWEQKSITIPGDTSGTWLTTNGVGLMLTFGLGIGSTYTGTANAWASSEIYSPPSATSVVGTNGATWYVTGVQLEKGSTATSFDYRPYGTELALCYRYYFKQSPFTDSIYMCTYTGSGSMTYIYWGTPMRATPTVTAIRTDTSASISTYPTLTGATLYTSSTGVAAASSVTATSEL